MRYQVAHEYVGVLPIETVPRTEADRRQLRAACKRVARRNGKRGRQVAIETERIYQASRAHAARREGRRRKIQPVRGLSMIHPPTSFVRPPTRRRRFERSPVTGLFVPSYLGRQDAWVFSPYAAGLFLLRQLAEANERGFLRVGSISFAGKLSVTTEPSSIAKSTVAFPQQPVIQLVNLNNVPLAVAGVQVTAAIGWNSPTGTPTVGGTVTVSTNSSGVATFTNLALTLTGTANVVLRFSVGGTFSAIDSRMIGLAVENWFVSTVGGGNGTEGSPWSIATAASGGAGAILANHRVYLRGGTYGDGSATAVVVTVATGTASNPVCWSNYPGERVVIDGRWQSNQNYNRLWAEGLNWVIHCAAPAPPSNNRDGWKTNGGTGFVTGHELINALIHDAAAQGVLHADETTGIGGLLYGNIVWHCGNEPAPNQEHGFYLSAVTGAALRVHENIAFQNDRYQFHGFADDQTGKDGRVEWIGDIAFGVCETRGGSYVVAGANFLDQRDRAQKTFMQYCYGWERYLAGALQFAGTQRTDFGHPASSSNFELDVLDCILYGGLRLIDSSGGAKLKVLRNQFYQLSRLWYEIPGTTISSAVQWDDNLYGEPARDTFFAGIGAWSGGTSGGAIIAPEFRGAGAADLPFTDMATWKTTFASLAGVTPDTGPLSGHFDEATHISGAPVTGQIVVVRPNAYERGRAHIVVYNHGFLDTFQANLSGVLSVGDKYEIRAVQTLFTTPTSHVLSAPVASGTYTGVDVVIPIGKYVPLDPIDKAGRSRVSPCTTAPDFGVFVCVRIPSTGAPAAAAAETFPEFWDVGLVVSGTSNQVVPLPARYQANDVAFLVVETANQVVAAPSGWVEVSGSPQGTGTAGDAAATRLTVFWRRLTASETAPTVVNPGDHIVCQIFTVRGCTTSGNPWDVTAGSVEAAGSASVSFPGVTTTVANCLVLLIHAQGLDDNVAHFTAGSATFANADLENLVMLIRNHNRTHGNGGGFNVARGLKRTAGAIAATTATQDASSTQARLTIALKP